MGISEDLILKYLQGECTDKDLEEINQWLAASPENVNELFTMELMYKSGKLKHFNETDYLEKTKQKLDSKILFEEKKEKRSFSYKLFYRYAAIFTLLLICGVTAYLFMGDKQTYLTLTAHEKIEELILPDGTKVWLNANTTLKYPEKFNSKKRVVTLEGEGYFEVVKNPDAPFIVNTEDLEITALGTSFNLRDFKDCNYSTITLTEGKVNLKGTKNNQNLILAPGQKAKLNKSSGDLYIAEESIRLPILWHKGLIPFHQATINDIAGTLEKLYSVKIEVDQVGSFSTYSGAIQKYQDIEKTLIALRNTIPIDYEIKKECIYIGKKMSSQME